MDHLVEEAVQKNSERLDLHIRTPLTASQERWRRSFLHVRIARAFSEAGDCARQKRARRSWRILILKVIAINRFVSHQHKQTDGCPRQRWRLALLKLRAAHRFASGKKPIKLKRCCVQKFDENSLIVNLNGSLVSPKYACHPLAENMASLADGIESNCFSEDEDGEYENIHQVALGEDFCDEGLDSIWNKLLSDVSDTSSARLDELSETGLEQSKIGPEAFHPLYVVGTGGSGQVYLAQHTKTRLRFAMKVLNKTEVVLTKRIDRVNTEREILTRAHESPLLTKLMFAFHTSDMLFFVMEYCCGGNLHEAMIRQHENSNNSMSTNDYHIAMKAAAQGHGLYGALRHINYFETHSTPHKMIRRTSSALNPVIRRVVDENKRVKEVLINFKILENHVQFIIAELIQGLKFLHDMGFVYRDLKPQNVMLNVDGHIRIGDFGISKRGECGPGGGVQLRSNSFVGTIEYMAPEVVAGDLQENTVDIWGLGVLTYELLTGTSPFITYPEPDDGNRELFRRILQPKHTVRFPKGLSRNAISFVQALLVRDPKSRMSLAAAKDHSFLSSIDWENLTNSSGFYKLQPRLNLHRRQTKPRSISTHSNIFLDETHDDFSRDSSSSVDSQPSEDLCNDAPGLQGRRRSSILKQAWKLLPNMLKKKQPQECNVASIPTPQYSVDHDGTIHTFHSGHTVDNATNKDLDGPAAEHNFINFDWQLQV
mmetsp:Transcript_20784/g.34374  ORF Transcript_20784/g.34374 Transcript_20784/m.34374 type:complete len:711 (-) Transcript_20784:2843-4975(-)